MSGSKTCLICGIPLNPNAGWDSCLAHRNLCGPPAAPSKGEGLERCVCGSKACACSTEHQGRSFWRIHCMDCDWSYGGSSLPACETEASVTAEWNRIMRQIREKGDNGGSEASPKGAFSILQRLAEGVREHLKAEKGNTYYLPLYEKGDGCRYCHQLRAEHAKNLRCPIKGCTLSGPPEGEPCEPTNPQPVSNPNKLPPGPIRCPKPGCEAAAWSYGFTGWECHYCSTPMPSGPPGDALQGPGEAR